MTTPPEVTLRQIADWQLFPFKETAFQVELPKLQRGFVWEPSKVADLWDSILRGFPVGSMMVSTIEPESSTESDPANRYWLLDGQQRATSIAIGFYNPWDPQGHDPAMWRLKSIPVLWLDLEPRRKEWDVKMFHSHLVTQSHPWGYDQDGGVITWGKRRQACKVFEIGDDYSAADLSRCFPWEANFPMPMCLLLEAGKSGDVTTFWEELCKRACALPVVRKSGFEQRLKGEPPPGLNTLFQQLKRLAGTRIHIHYLTSDAAHNDTTTGDDDSLLFVRLNSGGVVLGGEELIFSLFKSAFPLAKDAVEACAAGFMSPSKLFGLLVRLAASQSQPSRLARPISLRDFKKEIRGHTSALKSSLEALVLESDHRGNNEVRPEMTAAYLMHAAREVLCGREESAPDFCLPEAVATRTINDSPDIFLALLYWLRDGGKVEQGSQAHQDLLGRFTALSWFLPGRARAKQEVLKEWIAEAGDDVANRMWSGEVLSFLFTRKELGIPVLPSPERLKDALLSGVQAEPYDYDNLPFSAPPSFWEEYVFLKGGDAEADEVTMQRNTVTLMTFLNLLWPCRTMLLYAQRKYVSKRFASFGQWELTLKDTNCPWDWDHIYPSATGLHKVDPVYKDWHDTIGNLRVEGLSENRRDGASTPTEKLSMESNDGMPAWKNSFISEEIWTKMQSLKYRNGAIKDATLAREICGVVCERLVSIYEEWHRCLRIGPLMDEIRSIASDATEPTSPAHRPMAVASCVNP